MSVRRECGRGLKGEWVRTRPYLRRPFEVVVISEIHDDFSGDGVSLVIYLPDGEELVFREGNGIGFRWESDRHSGALVLSE